VHHLEAVAADEGGGGAIGSRPTAERLARIERTDVGGRR